MDRFAYLTWKRIPYMNPIWSYGITGRSANRIFDEIWLFDQSAKSVIIIPELTYWHRIGIFTLICKYFIGFTHVGMVNTFWLSTIEVTASYNPPTTQTPNSLRNLGSMVTLSAWKGAKELGVFTCIIGSCFSFPKDHWTLQWKGLNLYSRGRVLKKASFEGSGYLGLQISNGLSYIRAISSIFSIPGISKKR